LEVRDRSCGTLVLRGAPQLRRALAPGIPPEAGPLVPVREGWLLRRVEGPEPWNLVPQVFRRTAILLAILPPVVLDLISALLGGPTGMSFFAFVIAWRWSRPIADALIRRSLDRQSAATSVAGRSRGEPVRVRGRVRPGPCFTSAGGKWSAVLACYAGTVQYAGNGRIEGIPRSWTEIRGIDFAVDLDGGETVVVAARGAYLLPPSDSLFDMVCYRASDAITAPLGRVVRRVAEGEVIESVAAELVVSPGDEVEVFGVLDWEVTPAAYGAPGRGLGLSPVLRGSGRAPLVVRPRPEAPRA
jgi:hypothetical protein